MRYTVYMHIVLLTAFLSGGCSVTTEKADYTVVLSDGKYELRDYAPYIVAETVVDGTLEEAGNQAFGKLFGYISGNNTTNASIAMTAPVEQQPASEKIAMTVPVEQQPATGGWAVAFMMPATYTMETLPAPTDPAVKLRQVPARRIAAIRYAGTWSEDRYRDHLEQLRNWMTDQGYTGTGEPIWARYNPPITPWFLRRNEILIPCASGEEHDITN